MEAKDAFTADNKCYTIESSGKSVVTNPKGTLYMTANSSSGSKYYDLTSRMQSYVASRWQEDVPTYSVVELTDTTFTINTYRTDTNEKIDTEFKIVKDSETNTEDNNTEDNKTEDNNTEDNNTEDVNTEDNNAEDTNPDTSASSTAATFGLLGAAVAFVAIGAKKIKK